MLYLKISKGFLRKEKLRCLCWVTKAMKDPDGTKTVGSDCTMHILGNTCSQGPDITGITYVLCLKMSKRFFWQVSVVAKPI